VSPAYADGKIYIVTSQRHLYILDATNNGTKLASATTPSSSWSSPTVSNGRLYVGNNDWNVYSYRNYVTYEAPTPVAEDTIPGYVYLLIQIAIILVAVAVAIAYVMRKQRAQK
jgi:outer membrane protein assembly factor BamB